MPRPRHSPPSSGDAGVDPTGSPTLLDLLPIPMVILDRDGMTVLDVNAAALRILGLDSSEQAEGQTCETLLRCQACDDECAVAVVRAGRPIALSYPAVVARNGSSSVKLLLDAVPMSDGRTTLVLHPVPEGTPLPATARRAELFQGLVWVSPAMKQVVGRIIELAPGEGPVLITGERGTEKERVARALHAHGSRSGGPFVVVDCASECEEIGVGASPGTGFIGPPPRLESAAGGTLFLRAITRLPKEHQVELARFLGRAVGPNGGAPRILAADDGDWDEAVEHQRLAPELRERLEAQRIRVPALRERLEDLPVLAADALERIAARSGARPATLSGDATASLLAYNWPGNVHELEQVLRQASERATGGIVHRSDLPPELLPDGWAPKSERARTAEALRKAAGNISLAARMLGIHRITLWRRMRALGLHRRDFLPR